MDNDLSTLFRVCSELKEAGFCVAVFGGWAEELAGLASARPHGDIDLLLFASDFAAFDAWLENNTTEIPEKRYAHKRAFRRGPIAVELIRIWRNQLGSWATICHGHELNWPFGPLLDVEVKDIGHFVVACPAYLLYYRQQYPAIAAARSFGLKPS